MAAYFLTCKLDNNSAAASSSLGMVIAFNGAILVFDMSNLHTPVPVRLKIGVSVSFFPSKYLTYLSANSAERLPRSRILSISFLFLRTPLSFFWLVVPSIIGAFTT